MKGLIEIERLETELAIKRAKLESRLEFFACGYDGYYAPSVHRKVRGRYSQDERRCQYCWVIGERSWGKCECCGAPR